MSAASGTDGLTEEDVAALYRWLLGRLPESRETVRAFRSYYPDIVQGRRAIFESEEFQRFYGGVTGRRPAAEPDAAGRLAQAFLRRAGGTERGDAADATPGLRDGMGMMLRQLDGCALAVVVGQRAANLADLLPLTEAGAAILHVAPGFPAFMPVMEQIGTATTFRIGLDAPGAAAFLTGLGARIGVLVLLGQPASPGLLEAARPLLLPQSLVVIGSAVTACAAIVAAWDGMEALPPWLGLSIFHAGGWHLPVGYQPPAQAAAMPDPEEYPALALASIVRNEQASVGHMLHSVLPIVSFVVVLDTGSTDDTVKLARPVLAASGKPFVLEQHRLERFDTMRNAALDLVPDWVEWVLMLDADEALAPEDFAPLLALLRHAGTDAYALPRYNHAGPDMQGPVTIYPDRQIRLLRHTPDRRVRYSGAVHETVRGVPTHALTPDGTALGLGRGGPHIHHLVRRFRTPEQEARKQEFYRDLAARIAE